MAKGNNKGKWDLEPQKSSTAQFITYIASTGASDEKYEIRYEDENIWMSQKMLAQVYGVEVNTVNYHIKKIFADAELDERSVIRKIRITGPDGKRYVVKHYNLQVIIALGFKIDNARAIAFRKWANQIVSEYTTASFSRLRKRQRKAGRAATSRGMRLDMGIKHPVTGVDDLRTLNPAVAGEWFAEKNVGLNIADYVAGSAKRVWWKCSSCEHEWQTSIRARYQRGTGCPLCARIES